MSTPRRSGSDPSGRTVQAAGSGLLSGRDEVDALVRSESQLRALQESATEYAVIGTDPEGRITSWNQGALRVLGWAAEEAIGQPAHMIFTPEDRAAEIPEQEMSVAAADGRAADERWHLRKDGSRFWANGTTMPLVGGAGQGFVKVLRDRTAERRAEEDNAHLAAIVASSPDAIVSFSAEDARITSWNRGAEALFGYSAAEALGRPADILIPPEERESSPRGVFDAVVAGRIVEADVVRLANSGERIDVSVTAARMLAPDGRLIGVSSIYRDARERKRAEAAVAESETKFKAIANSLPQMVWSTLPDGYHDYYNERWYEFTGVPPGSTDGEAWAGMFHPDDQERAWARWRHSLATGEPYEVEYRLRHHSGEYRWTLGLALPIRDKAGRIVRWFGTCTDIDAQKRAQAELRRMTEMVEQAPDYIGYADREGRVLYANPAGRAMVGLTDPASARATRFRDYFTDDDWAFVKGAILPALQASGHWSGEFRLRRFDTGAVVPVDYNVFMVNDAAGQPLGAACVARDIGERRRAEEELRGTNAFLRSVLESSDDCIKVLELDGTFAFMSQGGLRVMEIDDIAPFVGVDWMEFWQGEDREAACRAVAAARAGGTGRFQGFKATAKGTPKWWDVVVTPILGPDGAPARILSISRDITEQRRTEEARQILVRELNHRVKNLFAIVAGMVAMTARTAESPKAMSKALQGRIAALAQAHDLIRPALTDENEAADSASLRELVEAVFAPYLDAASPRVSIEGPDLTLGARGATSLALVLHELATNAVKYGALSADAGRLSVAWRIGSGRLHLTWAETGGPPIDAVPQRRGFGSQLTQLSVTGQLGGTIETEWRQSGVRVAIALPLERLA